MGQPDSATFKVELPDLSTPLQRIPHPPLHHTRNRCGGSRGRRGITCPHSRSLSRSHTLRALGLGLDHGLSPQVMGGRAVPTSFRGNPRILRPSYSVRPSRSRTRPYSRSRPHLPRPRSRTCSRSSYLGYSGSRGRSRNRSRSASLGRRGYSKDDI